MLGSRDHFFTSLRARHKETIQKNVSFNRIFVYIDAFFTCESVFSLVTGAICPRGGSGAFARFSTRYTPLLHGEYTIYTIKGPDFGTPSSHSSRTGVFWVFWQKEIGFFRTSDFDRFFVVVRISKRINIKKLMIAYLGIFLNTAGPRFSWY